MEQITKAWEVERKGNSLSDLATNLEEIYEREHQALFSQLNAVKSPVERRLVETALQKLEFCYRDLFQIRKEKITISALQETPINEEALSPWEKQYLAELRRAEYLYRQNLGAGSKIPVRGAGNQTVIQSTPTEFPPSGEIISPDVINATESEGAGDGEEPETFATTDSTSTGDNYVTIRFLCDDEAIIGVDLREYGPFMTGDVVFLPEVHARIFIANGKAQQIAPSD
ncbi:MAG TPA: hypothetical protein VKK79_19485 [Candidatus Lokiarchaeia archaeon]|nr:hypothetical protein [Candidatus Lokiarchaeia archaeon]